MFDAGAHHALARAAAADCAVLLKNDRDILPLRPGAGDLVAVIGEFARTPRYQGAGSSQVDPTRLDAALDEVRAAVPAGVEVAFAAGFGVGSTGHDKDLAAGAVALARRASTVVVFLGLPAAEESEGFDRQHMVVCPPNQTVLLPQLAAANPEPGRGPRQRLGGTTVGSAAARTGHPRMLALRRGGRRRHGRPALRRGQAIRAAGRGTLPLRLQDKYRPTSTSPARPGTSATARVSSSATAATTPSAAALSATRSATACPTPPSATPTSPPLSSARPPYGDLAISVTCTIANTGRRAGKEVVRLRRRPVRQVASPHPRATKPSPRSASNRRRRSR